MGVAHIYFYMIIFPEDRPHFMRYSLISHYEQASHHRQKGTQRYTQKSDTPFYHAPFCISRHRIHQCLFTHIS